MFLLLLFYHQSTQKYSEIIDSKLNSIINRLVVAPLFNCEFTKRLPTQFIRSSGIDCTKYSRCSFGIKHIGRFFCVISSSRSFSDCSNSGNQISSHEQTNGLSNENKSIQVLAFGDWFKRQHGSNLNDYPWQMCLEIQWRWMCKERNQFLFTYRQCRPLVKCQWLVPSLLRVFGWVCYFECLTFPVNLNSQTMKRATPKC